MLPFENVVSVTDILRNGKSYFDDLAVGNKSQVLAMKNSQPAAVLLSPVEYEGLVSGKDLVAGYQLMRMNVMSLSLSDMCPFDSAYIFAWYNGVFPLLHTGADWHVPFGGCFRINSDEVNTVLEAIAMRWDNQNPITFYELEEMFGSRSRNSDLDRGKLIHICRYLFLDCNPKGDINDVTNFDAGVWKTLVKNGQCPSEAHSIIRPFNLNDIYFM